MRFLKAVSAGFGLLLGLAGAAQAQFQSITPEVPEDMRGIWSTSSSCAADRGDFWVLGALADLYIPTPEQGETLPMYYMALLADLPTYEGHRYFLDYSDGSKDMVRVSADRLTLYALPEDSSAATLDPAAVEATIEPDVFRRCASLPVGLGLQFSELVSFLLSDTLPRCRAGGEACLAAGFDFLDLAPDAELRPAELARGMRVLTLIALGLGLSQDGYEEEPYLAALAALPLLPVVGFSMVAQIDYDGSGGISLAEIGADRAALMPRLTQESDITDLAGQIPTGSLERLGALLRMMAN